MNSLVYKGTSIYWIAVKDGSYVGHGVLEKEPSMVSSKWNLESHIDREIWKDRLVNDFDIDPDAEVD